MSPSIQPLLREHLDDCKAMWEVLKQQYSQDNAASRFLIIDEFLSTSKQPDESLTTLCARVEDNLQKVKASCPSTLTLE